MMILFVRVQRNATHEAKRLIKKNRERAYQSNDHRTVNERKETNMIEVLE